MEKILSKPTVSQELARALVSAAEQKADDIGVPSVVAVVDESGVVKALTRMDNAPLASVQVAQDKAYSAASTRMPTDQWYQVAQQDPAFGFALPTGIDRLCAIGGGYPIEVDGNIVGGIGVSGGTPVQDMDVASAALKVAD